MTNYVVCLGPSLRNQKDISRVYVKLIEAESRKRRRVARSTFGAECISVSDLLDFLLHLINIVQDFIEIDQVLVFIDYASLVANINSPVRF